jgi:hypothetical protein
MAVRMRVGVIMAVVMGIGRRHAEMLYYNITSVYGGDGRHSTGFTPNGEAAWGRPARDPHKHNDAAGQAKGRQPDAAAPFRIFNRSDQTFENSWSTYSQFTR